MDLEAMFANATKETLVKVTYEVGREAKPQAIREAMMASDWAEAWGGIGWEEYIGQFESLKRSKKGDLILTLFVHNRGDTGRFRAFNPSLGKLKEVRILSTS